MKLNSGTLFRLTALSAFSILLIFSSCGENEPNREEKLKEKKESSVFHQLMLRDSLLFAGVHMGLNPEQIKDIRKLSPDEIDTSYLFYEVSFSDSVNYTVEYEFGPEGLTNAITIDIYMQGRKEADDEFEYFRSYFEKKYGPAIEERDVFSWRFSGTDKQNYYLELQDESYHYNYGKLTIFLADEKDREENQAI